MRFSPLVQGWHQKAFVAAGMGLILCGAAAVQSVQRFFQAYLFASLLFVGLSVGCIGLFLLYRLVGGAWGRAAAPVLEAGIRTLPWAGLLFIPVLAGMHWIFPWAHAEHLAGFPNKQLFFHPVFFVVRTLAYFGIWFGMARLLQMRKADGEPLYGQPLGAIGLLVYVMTVSFAAFDWMMSLEPHWASSIFGVIVLVGFVLSALAFTIILLSQSSAISKQWESVPVATSLDLGNLTLAFTMLWAYMALSQYLIIWAANIPEEITWYLARRGGGWTSMTVFLILFQFVVPFALLLSRKRKEQIPRLAQVAKVILIMRIFDFYWLVMPDFMPGHLRFHFVDIGCLLLVGGLWLMAFYRQMSPESHG